MRKRNQILIGVAVVLVAIQFLPYGKRTNPPVTGEPQWDSPATSALIHRSCYDCHSNQTQWPLYAYVAPVSWLVVRDVDVGRRHLNFTEWNRPQPHAKDIDRQVLSGSMPLWFYLPLHPGAHLTAADRQALAAGAARTFGPQAWAK